MRNPVHNFSIEIHEADSGVCKKRVFKLQSLLRKVLVHKYCIIKVQEKQSIVQGVQGQIKVFG